LLRDISVNLNGTAKKGCDQTMVAIHVLCNVQHFETNRFITNDFLHLGHNAIAITLLCQPTAVSSDAISHSLGCIGELSSNDLGNVELLQQQC